MPPNHCYLLCIGVDVYDSSSIPNLKGCVKDAQRFLDYIEQHYNRDLYQLHPKTLLSGGPQAPTRQHILQHIREHLGQAQTGDLAILFYAGHGSKEKAPPSFGEEDGYAQTLVPSDARTTNAQGVTIRNILDKEIRLLLHELAQGKQPDLVIIQDTCHSTGATRQAEQVRQVEDRFLEAKRLLEIEQLPEIVPPTPVPRYVAPDAEARGTTHWYSSSVAALQAMYTAFEAHPEALQQLVEHLDEPPSAATLGALPLADHIHLAACGKREFAYELPGEGGVFTSNLLSILAAAQNAISYHDLFSRLRLNIDGAYEQTPDLYVRGSRWDQRYETFLGKLLRQGELPPERDRDVFNGFYPVVPHGRNGWKIRAGELELLSVIQDKNIAVPIEVFLQSETPKGHSNAVIESVTPEYSTVRLTSVQFDRQQHRNQLYGMVSARYLRRWRVPIFVEQEVDHGSLTTLFERYGPRLQLKNFQHDGGPAIRGASDLARAHYSLTVQGDWLELRDAQGTLLLQSSAAQQATGGQPLRAAVVRRGEAAPIEEYRRGDHHPWQAIGSWSFSAYLKNALAPIFDYLKAQYERQPSKTLSIFLQEAPAPPHPFLTFLQTHAAQLEYFKPFIKWTSPDKASHVIRIHADGFALHHYSEEAGASAVPAARPTQGRHAQAGFEIMLQLQQICKWQTVRNLYNTMQATLLPHHQFELEAKIYTDFAAQNRGYRRALFQTTVSDHYENEERGLVRPLHELSDEGRPFHFVQHPELPSTVVLHLDIAFRHLVGVRPVFVSTLLLDPTYAVLPLQRVLGSNLLPPAEGEAERQGTLHLLQIELPRPDVMRHFPAEAESVTYYLKILMAYERFDVSGLLQDGLPPPAPELEFFLDADATKSGKRSTLTKVPEVGAPGSWLAFTIPLVVGRP